MVTKSKQQGLGLVEVMISLFILLTAAMASGKLQTIGMVSARMSSFHLSLDHLSSEMLETLRAHSVEANAGVFNFDAIPASGDGDASNSGDDASNNDTGADSGTDSVEDSVAVNSQVSKWNTRVSQVMPSGAASIDCTAGTCDVTISWIENIDGTDARQFYRTRTPL